MDSNTGLALVVATFASVFLAELGDKTQLATMLLSANAPASARFYVFLGAALALTLTSAIGAWAGGFVSRFLPPALLQRGAGALFVLLGGYLLWRSR